MRDNSQIRVPGHLAAGRVVCRVPSRSTLPCPRLDWQAGVTFSIAAAAADSERDLLVTVTVTVTA